jgi:beta-aspartyl-peptidase (threonine type)
LHGGAGTIERAELAPELETRYRDALREAAERGGAILASGGSALDAVTATVAYLEDNELFNAGRGAVFTAEGRNELDASIMDGLTRAAGSVAGLTHTRNPIRAARAVMEKSPHVMLVGAGADAFAGSQALEQVDPAYFFTEGRWRQLEAFLRQQNLPLPPRPSGAPTAEQARAAGPVDDHTFGTVGAVAFDRDGNLAAATSTGGTTGKRWGRVGDSPIIGAGTYAQNGVCGVSATGTGEFFIRAGVARGICARMDLTGESAAQAAAALITDVGALGGDGGVIVLDRSGRHAFAMNTSGMYRAYLADGGEPLIGIYADDD